jgi:hypothetical protein
MTFAEVDEVDKAVVLIKVVSSRVTPEALHIASSAVPALFISRIISRDRMALTVPNVANNGITKFDGAAEITEMVPSPNVAERNERYCEFTPIVIAPAACAGIVIVGISSGETVVPE